ncbi:ComEC/Rec2 family competence protein [Gallaecimonas mangrovi]|uniref:ComEC/Rec2 family competence protein n=1 Tax=Gallaecimonas mangrovi TaxID=2291597 RepID=UPI001865E902|nr:ComEC/Rec2 family competence protein [Gallaecimonas mangrovi]
MKVLPLLSWLLGLITPLFWEQLPSAFILVMLCCLALILLYLKRLCLAVFLVGICYSSLSGLSVPRPPLPAQDHSINGQVLAAGTTLYVQIKQVDGQKVTPFIARLGWYLASPKPVPGQTINAVAKLKPLEHRRNPGSRSYARRDAATGLVAVGYVKSVAAVSGSANWQSRWHHYLQTQLAPFSQQGLMLALLTGDRHLISREQNQQLMQTGTAHLLAISGLHVALVASLGLWLGHLLPGNGRRWGWFLGLVMAGLYAWQSGLAPPALRALVALSAWVLWLGWRQPLQGWRLWLGLLALFATLNPLVLLDSRLWLSFMAVALILLVLWRFPSRGLRALWVLQLGFSLLMWPLQLWLFGQLPAFSLLANVLAVPLVSLLVMPLLLAGLLLPGPWWLANHLLTLLMAWLGLLQGALPGTWVGLLLLPVLVALPLGRQSRAALAATWLVVGWIRPMPQGVWFLDVGQGTSTALISGGQMLLVDTGPGLWATDGAKALAANKNLALLVLSHADKDHVGGAAAFAAPVLAGQPTPGQQHCVWQQHWAWAGGALTTLWPPPTAQGSDNDQSCVLWGTVGKNRFLLPGDISQTVELQRHWPLVDWLAVPHHGSKTSSSSRFVAEVRPAVAVFSTGYANAFGFPAAEVVARYRSVGAEVWDTGRQGALFCSNHHCQGLKRFWWERSAVGVARR